MKKDFDNRNKIKKSVDTKDTEVYFRERDIWWISLGTNIGFEQDGKSKQFTRPVLILRKFSKNVFIGIPLSTSSKRGAYYFEFKFNERVSVALLSQICLLDSKRLVKKIGTINHDVYEKIRQAVKDLL